MNLVVLTPLVCFPLFSDLYSLPKLLYLSAVSLFLLLRLILVQYKRPLSFPLLAPITLFLLAALLSAKNMVNGYEWLFAFSTDLMGVAVFYYTVNFLKIENVERLAQSFVMSVSLMAALALMAYYTGFPHFLADFHEGRGGTMGNRNFAALLTAMAIPIILMPRAWATLPFAAVLLWHLGITASRGAFVALGAVMCVWGLFLKGFERIAFAVLGMFVVTIVVLFAQGNLSMQTLEHRLTWWKGSILMAKDHPVFGVGRGNWPLVYPMYAGVVKDKTMDRQELADGSLISKVFVNAAHNDYLQILAETGLLGLISLLWFICQLIPVGAELKEPMLGIFLGWLVLLIGALFSFPFQLPELSIFFWLFSAVLALHGLKPKPVNSLPTRE